MGVITVCKIILPVVANLALLTAVSLTLTAMFTAKWQIADFGNGEVYEHGLYKDCVKTLNQRSGIKTTGDWLCFWKFDQRNQEQASMKSIVLKEWQITALALFGTACGLALLAAISSCIVCCVKYLSIPWAILSFLAAILSLAGVITFLRWSTESENRLIQMRETTVEQEYGLSFTLAIIGCALFFFAAVLAAIAVALVFVGGRRYERVQTTATHYSHTTKV